MKVNTRLPTLLRLLLATLALFATARTAFATTEPVTRNDIKQRIVRESDATGLPSALALAVAKVGSDFQARALNQGGARGVMQLYPQTVAWVATDDLWKPGTNIRAGVRYLNQLIQRYFGRRELALSHYHSGYGPEAPLLTRVEPGSEHFVESVLRWEARYRAQSALWNTSPSQPDPANPSTRRALAGISLPAGGPVTLDTAMEVRRRQARRSLDDFGARRRPRP